MGSRPINDSFHPNLFLSFLASDSDQSTAMNSESNSLPPWDLTGILKQPSVVTSHRNQTAPMNSLINEGVCNQAVNEDFIRVREWESRLRFSYFNYSYYAPHHRCRCIHLRMAHPRSWRPRLPLTGKHDPDILPKKKTHDNEER